MTTNVANKATDFQDYAFTHHALQRMSMRRVPSSKVNLVLTYGRKTHTRGAIIYVIGKKEISQCAAFGIDLSELDGLQVVCSNEGAVITVYRNRDLRGLRPRQRRGH